MLLGTGRGIRLGNSEGTMKKKKLGEVLRDRGKITPEALLTAIADTVIDSYDD